MAQVVRTKKQENRLRLARKSCTALGRRTSRPLFNDIAALLL